jgi:hypothetical protein
MCAVVGRYDFRRWRAGKSMVLYDLSSRRRRPGAKQLPIGTVSVLLSSAQAKGVQMAKVFDMTAQEIDRFQFASRSGAVSDELTRITTLIRSALPEVAGVSLSFDSKLQVHIDVRRREDVTVVELILPNLEPGLFQGIGRGRTPGHPFHHRVTAGVCA